MSTSEQAPRELVVILKPDAGGGLAPAAAAGLPVSLVPLFGTTEDRLRLEATSLAMAGASGVPDLSVYYRAEAPDERLDALAEELRADSRVEAAYVKPSAELPDRLAMIDAQAPSTADVPPVSPSFVARQGYLDAAPGGIDAHYAWAQPGGRGAGVRIIDIEGAWRFSHEDLLQNQGGVIGGTQSTDIGWRNHGTAVIGEFGGDHNGFGITGICSDANVRAIAIFGIGSAAAIRNAANALGPGDIILIELHRPGPRHAFANRNDQRGYIAVEWWPDDLAAIRYATSRGVIVVEAAGNGAEDLDDPLYDVPAAGFPASWRNPFRRGAADSGAVIVGAGAPPPGTHGRNHGPDRSRLDFSNFGAVLDAQGWGREVTTTAYGDLQGGSNEDLWYTDQFSGTSSASPIVVGALGCIQGMLRARGRAPLTPAAARSLLRTSGSPQLDAPGRPATQRIGSRPSLRDLAARLLPAGSAVAALHRYWNPTAGDHFYTTHWAELGAGRHGWAYEGVQCYVHPTGVPGTVPLHRYWNAGIGDHFYTTNWAELGAGRYGWAYEGIQCHVHSHPVAGTVPLHRYWNAGIGDHFYTTDWAELGAGRHGWSYEGIQCYVHTQPIAAPEASSEEESGELEHATGHPEGSSATGPSSFVTHGLGSGDPLEPERPSSFSMADARPSSFVTTPRQGSLAVPRAEARPSRITVQVELDEPART